MKASCAGVAQAHLEGVGDGPPDAVISQDVIPEAQHQHFLLEVSPFRDSRRGS
jgi:hypothetical protein